MANTTPTPPPNQPATDFSKQLANALAALAAGLGARAIAGAGGNPLTQAVPPQLSQLLDQSVARTAYQNPLFQATTQGVYSMLPTFARQGTALSGTLSNAIPAAPASSGGPGLGSLAGIGSLGALAALLGSGSGAGGNFGKLIQDLINKFKSKPAPPLPGLPPSKPISPDQFPGFTFPSLGDLPAAPLSPDQFPGFSIPQWPNVSTDEWLGQWPETSDPFAPFDPSLFGGGSGTGDESDEFGWRP